MIGDAELLKKFEKLKVRILELDSRFRVQQLSEMPKAGNPNVKQKEELRDEGELEEPSGLQLKECQSTGSCAPPGVWTSRAPEDTKPESSRQEGGESHHDPRFDSAESRHEL